jgi:hypothetical protein
MPRPFVLRCRCTLRCTPARAGAAGAEARPARGLVRPAEAAGAGRERPAAQSARASKDAAAGVVGSQSAAVVLASHVALVRAEAAADGRVRDLTQQARLLQQPPQQPVSAFRLSLIASPVFAQGRAAVVCAVRALSYDMRVLVGASLCERPVLAPTAPLAAGVTRSGPMRPLQTVRRTDRGRRLWRTRPGPVTHRPRTNSRTHSRTHSRMHSRTLARRTQ